MSGGCIGCGAPPEGTSRYLCDEEAEGVWFCPSCFEESACGRGEHGEGCATFMAETSDD
jgi:hypothetical protein